MSGGSDGGSRALRIGTRGSALALVQAGIVADALRAAGVATLRETIVTEGDRRAPDTAWGEGAFVGAIEAALLDGRVDVAVHSAKDVPTDEDRRLRIAAYLPREDPADVLVVAARDRSVTSLDDLPAGAVVGTDSPRRTAFLRAARPDLEVRPLHGNVDTRLRRLDEGRADALVLAAAGLRRLGRADRIAARLDPRTVPPAPGQGALAVQVRSDDAEAQRIVAALDDAETRRAVEAERALLRASGGGCRAPLGALGLADGPSLRLLAGYARPDGGLVAVDELAGAGDDPDALAGRLLERLALTLAAAARDAGAPRVIVTRPAGQAAAVSLALVDRGFAPLAVPAIEVEPVDGPELAAAVAALPGYAWVVVTSANAATIVGRAAAAAGIDLSAAGGPRWAAVGRATESALRRLGVGDVHRPRRSTGSALADELPVGPGQRVLLPRGDLADPDLPDGLRRRGADVDPVVVYRTVEAPAGSARLLAAALEDGPAGWTATSPSAVRGLLALAAAIGAGDVVRALPLVAIGPTTAAEAERLGLVLAATATAPAPGAIADATAAALLVRQEVS